MLRCQALRAAARKGGFVANNPAVADVMEEIFQSILATPKRQRRLLSKTFWGKFRIERRTAERVEEIREALRQRDLILNIDDAEFGKEDKGTWLILSHVRPSPPTVGTPSQYTLWRMQLCRKSVMIRSDRIFCQYRRETQGGQWLSTIAGARTRRGSGPNSGGSRTKTSTSGCSSTITKKARPTGRA